MEQNTLIPQTQNQEQESLLKDSVKPEKKASAKPDKSKKHTARSGFWWGLVFIIIAIIALFLVLTNLCTCMSWRLALILLLDFLLLLIINYLNKFKKNLWWLFGLLLIAVPIVVLVVCASWVWWLWVIVIVLYLATMATYLIGLLEEKYWRVVVPLNLFLILMLIILTSCPCK